MKKTLHYSVLLFVIFAIHTCAQKTTNKSTLETGAKKESSIKEWVQKGAFLVDVRTSDEFAEGSFKDAVNIPLNEIENRKNEFEGKPAVIVFCRSGSRSSSAKRILESYGIKNVINGINVENMETETK